MFFKQNICSNDQKKIDSIIDSGLNKLIIIKSKQQEQETYDIQIKQLILGSGLAYCRIESNLIFRINAKTQQIQSTLNSEDLHIYVRKEWNKIRVS